MAFSIFDVNLFDTNSVSEFSKGTCLNDVGIYNVQTFCQRSQIFYKSLNGLTVLVSCFHLPTCFTQLGHVYNGVGEPTDYIYRSA